MSVVFAGSGCVHLCAPPGCGKTLLLYLKGVQWLTMGLDVHVVCMRRSARAVSSLLARTLEDRARTLRQTQGTAATVTTHHVYSYSRSDTDSDSDSRSDFTTLVTTLARLAGSGVQVRVLVDEVPLMR